MEFKREISYSLNSKKLGNIYEVLIEEQGDENLYVGRSYMDSPEIDGIIYVSSDKKLEIGQFIKVKITDYLEYDLIGEIVDEFGK